MKNFAGLPSLWDFLALLAIYLGSYAWIRSHSYVYANRLNFGVFTEELAVGYDRSASPTGARLLQVAGWFYVPLIVLDERRDEILLRIEFPGRPGV